MERVCFFRNLLRHNKQRYHQRILCRIRQEATDVHWVSWLFAHRSPGASRGKTFQPLKATAAERWVVEALHCGFRRVVLFEKIEQNPTTEIFVDLPNETLAILETDIKVQFEINAYKKECLLNGYDDIDYILSMKDKIEAFENN